MAELSGVRAGVSGLSYLPVSGQQFVYDTSQVLDQQITQLNYVYATGTSSTQTNNGKNFNNNFDENFN